MKTKKNVKIKDDADRKKSLHLCIVQSSFRDKADLTKWVHETAGKTPYRPDARLITSRPFQDGGGYLCDAEYAKQKQLGVQVELTDEEKILIGHFVGVTFSYNQRFIDRLECAITQKCGLQDTKRFTWDKIIACIENYNSMNRQGNTADMNKPQGKGGQSKRGRKKDPKVRCRNKEIAKYRSNNPKLSWKEIGIKFDVSADIARKACNNPYN